MESTHQLILEIESRMAHYARQGKGAQEALEKLKQLAEMIQELEFRLEVAETAIEHG